MFIRIIAMPPGKAPDEVRRAWIGLELPLAEGETGPRVVPTSDDLAGPPAFRGTAFERMGNWKRLELGYVVSAPEALALLGEKAPWAAQWWRECAGHFWEPGRTFVFPPAICVPLVAGAPAQPPPEGIVPAPSAEVALAPTHKTGLGMGEQPLPVLGDRGLRIGDGTGDGHFPFTDLMWVGLIGCISSALFVLADLVSGRYGMIAVRALFFVVGVVLIVWSWRTILKIDREIELLRRKWAPLSEGPTTSSGGADRPQPGPGFVWGADAAGLTLETRGQTVRIAPEPFKPGAVWVRMGLLQRSPDCLEIVPTMMGWVLGALGIVGLPLALWGLTCWVLIGAHPWPHPRAVSSSVLAALMQLAASAGPYLTLAVVTRRARIDLGKGEVRLGRLFQEHVACRASDVFAVQVLGSATGGLNVSQVNLVLGGPVPGRIQLAVQPRGDRGENDSLWLGRRLAVFLDVPLADQVEALAIVGPAELVRFFALDHLAGPHNARLTEVAKVRLELQPFAHRCAPLTSLEGWPVHRACAAVKFERGANGAPSRLFVRLLPGSGPVPRPDTLRRPRPLQDVVGVELAPDTREGLDFPELATRRTCRLCLLLNDAGSPILVLAPHADEAWARETGQKLARFLDVALTDRIR